MSSQFLSVQRWQSLNGYTCGIAKAFPISLAKVPTNQHIAVDRNLEPWWLYEGELMLWPRELFKNTSVWQSAVLVETGEGQVRGVADVPSARGATGCFFWVIQQYKVVWCCPGVQALTVKRCFVVAPVDMFAVEVANIQAGVWDRRDGRWCESRAWRFVDVNDLISCNVYAQPFSLW